MTQKKPSCSLIVSTYNRPEALRLSLESVARQTVFPDEVLVADDGSGAETRALIDKLQATLPSPLRHIWHEDKGFRLAEIRNRAIAEARGEYIVQMDGDIILEQHFIEDHLANAREGFFTSGSRVLMDETLSKKILAGEKISLGAGTPGIRNRANALRIPLLTRFFRSRYKKNHPEFVKGCNMAFWKKDLLAVNGYNEKITGWGREDSEIAVRLAKLGIARQYLKFSAIQFHIFHKECDRSQDPANIEMLKAAINSPECHTPNGICKNLCTA